MISELPFQSRFPIGSARLDKSRRFAIVDAKFATTLGLTSECLLGHSLDEFICHRDRKLQAAYLREISALRVGECAHFLTKVRLDCGADELVELRAYRGSNCWDTQICAVDTKHVLYGPLFGDSCWQSTIRGSNEGIAVLDQEARLVEFNLPLLDLLRLKSKHGVLLSAEAAKGRFLFQIVEAGAFEPVQQAFMNPRPNRRRYKGAIRYRSQTLKLNLVPIVARTGQWHAVLTVKDLTAETESERLRVDLARTAGKAEVATGVLHNVGNALNSLNISVDTLYEYIESSKVGVLDKVAKLIREHRDDLASFLTEDPKGQHVPRLIQGLADALNAEQQELLRTVEEVKGCVSHISGVVTEQQSFARLPGMREQVVLHELVDAAVSLSELSLQRHQIRIIRRYDSLPTIELDRHRTVQIVANLIENAKHALTLGEQEDKRITLILRQEANYACLIVEDNGVGIGHEILQKIFQYGFTTKKEGHGFGLHSCANAASEMGGSLHAESRGLGLGASFALRIPFSSAEEALPKGV